MCAKRSLLLLTLAMLLLACGAAYAGAAKAALSWVQIPVAPPSGGTAWTSAGITHVRGQTTPTLALWDYDGDGVSDNATLVVLTHNFNVDRDGAGPFWGTWVEYEFDLGTWTAGDLMVENGTFQGKYTASQTLPGPQYAFGWVNIAGTGFIEGLDSGWGRLDARADLYAGVDPTVSPAGILFAGEGSFLIPGGKLR